MSAPAGFPATPRAGGFDRRRFLDALLTVGFVSTAAAIAYPVSRFLIPPESGEAATNSVVAAKASAIKPNAGLIFPFGWLIPNLHSWSGNLLIGAAFAHFFSVFVLKSYRKPRELTWVSGVLLLFLMLGFGFSGYLLPWNELSFFATKVGTGMAGSVPIAGHFLIRLLRGGDDVTGATLSRFFGVHVAILPAISTALVALHLLLVQRQGMSVPLRVERQLKPGERVRQMAFFPNYILRDVLLWYVALAALAALAAFSPWGIGKKADPFAAVPPGIRPEWYFLAMFHPLKLIPSHLLGFEGERLGVIAFGLVAVFLVFVPFLDRRSQTGRSSPLFTAIAVGGVLYLVVFTILAQLAS